MKPGTPLHTRRSSLVENNVHSALSAYKQTTVEVFLERVSPPQAEPQAGVPEEGIVIEGSTLCVADPGDLPAGRDVGVEDGAVDDPDPVSA